LIAKDVLEADIIINLPKLKMHKKAGVTNALKNFVGSMAIRNIFRIIGLALQRCRRLLPWEKPD
jgi:hypothetical protein